MTFVYDNGNAVSGASVSISVPDQVLTETTNGEGKYIYLLYNYTDGDRITITIARIHIPGVLRRAWTKLQEVL
jgi:hypothetical protein